MGSERRSRPHGRAYGDSAGVATGRGKPVHLAFDGGLMTSEAGILLLAAIEQRLGIVKRSADCLEDRSDPERVRHTVAEMIRYPRPVDRGGLSRR